MTEHAITQPIPHRVDYEPDVPYFVLESHLTDNEMSSRTFPKIKPQKYDPEALAKSLAKSKKDSLKKTSEE